MKNMNIKVVDGKLLIEVDLNAEGTKTNRGNTIIAATSNWESIDALPEFTINMALVRRDKKQRY